MSRLLEYSRVKSSRSKIPGRQCAGLGGALPARCTCQDARATDSGDTVLAAVGMPASRDT